MVAKITGGCLAALIVFAAGCAEQQDDDWYEFSRDRKEEKERFIDAQSQAGIDPAKASRQFEGNRAVIKTIGREGNLVEDEDLEKYYSE